jgi:non-lysosomal glucosylceramidase
VNRPERGIEFIANTRRRYDGERRNPWNEPECGHHYARAMSSWSPVLAASGFEYDAPSKRLRIAPAIATRPFRSIWSTGSAWGTFELSATKLRVSTQYGELSVEHVVWPGAKEGVDHAAVVTPGKDLVL